MKDSNNRLFLGLTALFGALGAGLRMLLFRTALDEKGLLITMHPANLGLWALSVGFVAVIWLLLKKRLGDNGIYADSFPPCRIRFGLSAGAGVLLAIESLGQLGAQQWLVGGLGLLAAISMAAGGVYRLKGKQTLPLFHILVCCFFIARLVTSFRGWSTDPQLQDYAMQLLACVSAMLFAFHRASCDANLIDREAVARYSLYAGFFAVVSLTDPEMPLLYAAIALWSIGAGPTLKKLKTEN